MYTVEYYTEKEKIPVLEFLLKLTSKEQAKILREIDLLQEFGLALGMPHIKKMQGTQDLWELRIKHGSNNFRIFYFCYIGGKLILLHCIRKTSGKTPAKDIKLAIKRRDSYLKERDQYES